MGTTRHRFRTTALAAAALLFAWSAPALAQQEEQQEQQQEEQQQQPQQASERAGLRIAHLVVDGPTVDVLVNGETVIEGLSPNRATGYVFLQAGEHTVEVVSADGGGQQEESPPQEQPADPAAEDPAVQDPAVEDPAVEDPAAAEQAEPAVPVEPQISQTVSLEAGTYGTLLVTRAGGGGQQEDPQQEQQEEQQEQDAAQEDAAEEPAQEPAAAGDGQIQLQAQYLPDEFDTLPQAGMASVRIVGGAPDAGSVRVVATPAGGEPQQQQEQQQEQQQDQQQQEQEQEQQQQDQGQQQEGPAPIEGQDLASGLAFGSGGPYTTVPSGQHRVQVQAEDGTVLADVGEMTFEGGLLYTLYVASTGGDASNVMLTPAVDGGVSRYQP